MQSTGHGIQGSSKGPRVLLPRSRVATPIIREDPIVAGRKRKNVSSACTECRKRRVKCDGKHPTCTPCERALTKCTYTADGRRKPAGIAYTKRLESDSKRLQVLIDTIKNGSESNVQDLVSYFKNAASTEQIETWLQEKIASPSAQPGLSGSNYVSPVSTLYHKHSTLVPSIETSPSQVEVLDSINMLPYSSTQDPSSEPTSKRRRLTSASGNNVREQIYESVENVIENSSLSSSVSLQSSQQSDGDSSTTETQIESTLGRVVSDAILESQIWHPALRSKSELHNRKALLNTLLQSYDQSSAKRRKRKGSPISEFLCMYPEMRLLRGLSDSDGFRSNGYSQAIQKRQLQVLQKPEWEILPLSFDDGSPMSRALMSFLKDAKVMIQKGVSPDAILGGARPQVDMFFQPGRPTDSHNVGNWASTFMSSFTELDDAVRLRSILLCFKLMKWMIAPSADNYSALPPSQRPTMAQRLIPHNVAIDIVHQADVRTALCQRPRDFNTPALGNKLNWSKRLDEAVELDLTTGSLNMTEEFEQHALNMRNWTYTSAYLHAFPEIAGQVQVEDS